MSDEAPQGADVQWIEVRFRDETVHARATPDGRVLTRPDGFVDFVYKLGGKAYKTRPDRLITVAGAAPKAAPAAAPRPAAKRASRGQAGTRSVLKMGAMRSADTAIMMWTDGACTGNPGPAGAGVYCEHQGHGA